MADPPEDLLVEGRRAQEVLDQALGFLLREGDEADRGGLGVARSPGGPGLEEVWPGEAQEEDRRTGAPPAQVLNEVEERGLAPVDVLEHNCQRPPFSQGLEEPTHRPERLLRGGHRVGQAQDRGEPLSDGASVLLRVEEWGDLRDGLLRGVLLGDAGGLPDNFRHGPVRDAVPVRETPALEHGRPVPKPGDELRGEAGLAHPRRADDGDQAAGWFAAGPLEGLPERRQLLVATDDGRVEAPGNPRCLGGDLEEPPRRLRLGLALQLQGPGELHGDRVPDQAVRGFAEEDLAGRGGLLQAGGEVCGVGGERRVGAGLVGKDLAGVHPGPSLDADGVAGFQVVIEIVEGGTHLAGRPCGPQRVVLVDLGDPEHRHDGIPDVFLHGAAMPLENLPHAVEVGGHHPTEDFRIQPLS